MTNITFGAERLTIENVVAISQGATASLNDTVEYRQKIDRGVAFLERLLKEDGVIYGVTTGYGAPVLLRFLLNLSTNYHCI